MNRIIAIIIPVHDSLPYTRECLDALMPMVLKAGREAWRFHVLVVNDGSTDGTGEWIRGAHPDVHVLEGDGSLWWGGAMNKGMAYALHSLKAEYVLWWNNDIRPASDYFMQLIGLLEGSNATDVWGSKLFIAEKPERIWAYGGFFHRRWGHSYLNGSDEEDGRQFSKPLRADWLPGMGTLLPAVAIREIGEVDEKAFPQYHGDIDYTSRARLAGHKLVVQPSLRIWNQTRHSGRPAGHQYDSPLAGLRDIKSLDHFRKEWLLYRRYARNPLAYLVLAKKYAAHFVDYYSNKLDKRW